MPQKKPVRSLDSLASLLSDEQKEKFKKEHEEIEKKHKKAMETIKGLSSDLKKQKMSDKDFNAKYDSLKLANANIQTGTDKDGDFIIHNKIKYSRSAEIKTPL